MEKSQTVREPAPLHQRHLSGLAIAKCFGWQVSSSARLTAHSVDGWSHPVSGTAYDTAAYIK